jgi:hypothetical protein
MKKTTQLLMLSMFCMSLHARNFSSKNSHPTHVNAVVFTENKGQVYDQNFKPRPDVLYGSVTGNMAVHIKKSGVSYQLYRFETKTPAKKETRKPSEFALPPVYSEKEEQIQTIYRIDLNWINVNKNFTAVTYDALQGYNNYYLASCPNGALNVKSYKGIFLKNLYQGIDLHYYEKNGELKHDYIVAPFTDYKKIQLKVEGAEISFDKDGSLLLTTVLGTVKEDAPVVFQNGKKLKARWLLNKDILSFEIENYDPTYELIIDPVTRLWGTYYGGPFLLNGSEYGHSSSTDAFGNVYLSGNTVISGTIIATSGTHQTTLAGSDDAFLAKFDENGLRLWGTFYGGTNTETGISCAAEATGNVYLTGLTRSTTGIATSGTFKSTHSSFSGSNYDGYLVKFNSNGVRIWGSYFGGSNEDFPSACALAGDGVYVAGTTDYSSNGIFTNGVHQPANGGGIYEAFLVKFNPLNGLQFWGTFYGGTSDDRGFSCATDASNNVYLSGYSSTTAGNIIATNGSHQQSIAGTGSAYLAKFNSSGTRLWGTYYGNNQEFGLDCATDALGNVYLSGNTYSTALPGNIIATPGTHQTFPGGGQEAFIVKMNSNGVRQWGTYYGGSGLESGNSCAVDAAGNVFLTGITTTSNNSTALATLGGYQTNYGGGNSDVYFVKFDAIGTRVEGSFYGGTGNEEGGFVSLSLNGLLYIVGTTGSSTGTVIASASSHQPIFGGAASDPFLAKFDICQVGPSPSAINGATSTCVGVIYTYSTPVVAGASSFTWALPAGWTISGNNGYSITTAAVASGIFSLMAQNACGVSIQTLSIFAYQNPTVSVNSGTICSGKTFTLAPSGAISYLYSDGPLVSPTVTSSYTVTGISSDGCKAKALSTITVFPSPILTVENSTVCLGELATFSVSGATNYTWLPTNVSTPVFTVLASSSGNYSVVGTDLNSCSSSKTFSLLVDECTGIKEAERMQVGIKIIPNPNSGKFVIEFKEDGLKKMRLSNHLGQLIQIIISENQKQEIDISTFAKGIYYLNAASDLGIHWFKVVVE